MTPTPPESPDQGPEHNPDNLSPEQYGAPEWRLLRVGEGPRIGDEVYHGKDSWRTVTWKISGPLSNAVYDTYRRRVEFVRKGRKKALAQLAASEKDRKALETAAQGLREELLWRMQQLDAVCGGEPCESPAIKAFDALKEGK